MEGSVGAFGSAVIGASVGTSVGASVGALVYKQSVENGTRWVYGPAHSPWYQGVVNTLVKAAKRSFEML